MGNVDPTVLRDVFIILSAIVGMACMIYRTVTGNKRKPSMDSEIGTIMTKVKTIAKELEEKQDSKVCDTMHHQMDEGMREVRQRHAAHEKKMSEQVSGLYRSIERLGQGLGKQLNKLEGTVETYIHLREGK